MAKDTCYYDARCGLCRRSVTILRRLDWLGRLEFADMNSARDLPVEMDQAMRGMPMRTRDGRVLVGFPAVRRALLQTPLGCVPGAILYVPGISGLGRLGYNWVAMHRRRDSCAIGHSDMAEQV